MTYRTNAAVTGVIASLLVTASLAFGQVVTTRIEVLTVKKEAVDVKKVDEPAVAEKKVVAPEKKAGLPPGVDAATFHRFTVMIQPMLKTETHFLYSICEPGKEQRVLIEKKANEAMFEAAKKVAEWEVKRRQPQVLPLQTPEPRKEIAAALAAAAKSHLSPEQWERYHREVRRKEADLKHASVCVLVSQLDQALFLTSEQRAKLANVLSESWDDAWVTTIMSLGENNMYFPVIPDKVLVPILTESQRKIWQGVTKIHRSSFGLWGGPFDNQAGVVAVGDGDEIIMTDEVEGAVEVEQVEEK